MQINSYRFNELSFFSKLLSDYTQNKFPDILQPQFSIGWEGFDERIKEDYSLFIDRDQLSETIFKQYDGIEISDKVGRNILSLKENNTFCVTTAHQLSFLGGPLYYVIKIANTISLARELQSKYPDKNFVPVYWMGSEDHDFEEVNHIFLFGNKYTWNTEQSGPVGRFSLDNIQECIQQVLDKLGENNPNDIQSLIRKSYLHKTVEGANRELVNGLFGKHGLLVVNGDDYSLKVPLSKIIQNEIIQQKSFQLLLKRSELLKEYGYHAQANGRAVNLFYLSDTFRTKIEPIDNHKFKIGDNIWNLEDLVEEANQHPERFSPNVILRPLFQQAVLPSIGFIGGGSEVAYWMQTTEVFKYHQVSFPVVIPRTSLMWVNNSNFQKFQKLNLHVSAIFKDKEILKKEYLLEKIDVQPDLEVEKNFIHEWMDKIKEKACQIDSTLGPAVGADAQKIQSILSQIEGKMLRSIKHKNETILRQIDGLYHTYFPNHTLQERHDNFLNFYSVYGQKFIDCLVEQLLVIDQEFVIMTENERLSVE
ncbi:MAG: bacillithiol biosynthesis cysteine-adding enzyme BshC [Chitinophagales bacterium]|nr:bacillithiol biosynthesis cysteine-adding enzyme BshC [Chitinophagales bacterium]